METIPDKWKPTVAMLNKYADMNRALEIELGVRADVERANVPHSWYAELKKLNWDAKKFKENFLKEIENEKRTIMSDHENIGKALEDLGKGSYSENRQYGNYGK